MSELIFMTRLPGTTLNLFFLEKGGFLMLVVALGCGLGKWLKQGDEKLYF